MWRMTWQALYLSGPRWRRWRARRHRPRSARGCARRTSWETRASTASMPLTPTSSGRALVKYGPIGVHWVHNQGTSVKE